MQDKFELDQLAFLGLEISEMVTLLAKRDGRTPIEEVKYLIMARFSGQHKDLGDDRSPVRLHQSDLSQILRVASLDIEPSRDESDNGRSPNRGPVRPK